MPKTRQEELEDRYERLDKLISLLSHGEAKIVWCDFKIVKIEKIVTEAVIDK